MRTILFLSWRYLVHHRVKSALLVTSFTCILFLPIAVTLLVRAYEAQLEARARSTPLLVGPRGSHVDLALDTLYLRPRSGRALEQGELEALSLDELALVIPLHLRFSARGAPVVATSPEYFELRGLEPAAGELPLFLGDATLGAAAASRLGLSAGDHLVTDQQELYDISGASRVKLNVVGVLAPGGTPDDAAVFVDLKTGWLLEGIGHGHEAPSDVTSVTTGNSVLPPSATTYVEVTPDNVGDFHFHGEDARFPLSAAIVIPHDAKSRTILRARHETARTVELVEPLEVVRELMQVVLKVKRLLDLNSVLVLVATFLLVGLIVLLSARLRADERRTLVKIGCDPSTLFWIQATELLLLLFVSLALVVALSAGLWRALDQLFGG